MPQQDAAAYFHLHRLYPYSLQNQLISGLFDAENCHIRRLLSLVLKSVDFGAKKPLSCLSDASHGKTPTPPFKRRSERKKQRLSHPN
jgi:hypothetical protein